MARIEYLEQPTNFLASPVEFLIAKLAEKISDVSQFSQLFGPRIEPYLRMDYGIRELPALRIYNTFWTKEYETWYINGDIVLDVIMPPQVRRENLQQYADTIAGALCQQFRRPTFFSEMCDEVPGLNELGKRFEVDKTLQFKFEGLEAPIIQIQANFRLLLDEWTQYMITQNRTVDDPFAATLGDLERITSVIAGEIDDGTLQVSIESDQTV